MKISNSKASVIDIFGQALAAAQPELGDSPVPEYQFRNKYGEYIFKWKITPGITAWWIVIKPLEKDQFEVVAANQDRASGEIKSVHRSKLTPRLVCIMWDIIARERQEANL